MTREAIGLSGIWLLLSTVAGLVAGLALLLLPWVALPSLTSHAYGAVTGVIFGYAGIHALVASIMTGYLFYRSRRGFLSAQRSQDLRTVRLWWSYVTGAGILAIAAVYLLPEAFGG